jgi:hypothetical protein
VIGDNQGPRDCGPGLTYLRLVASTYEQAEGLAVLAHGRSTVFSGCLFLAMSIAWHPVRPGHRSGNAIAATLHDAVEKRSLTEPEANNDQHGRRAPSDAPDASDASAARGEPWCNV